MGLKKSVFVCVFLKEIFKEALKQLTEAASETETKSCVCILATTERLSWDMSFLLVTLAGSLIMWCCVCNSLTALNDCCRGLVPLHNACSYGHYEVTELLIKVCTVISHFLEKWNCGTLLNKLNVLEKWDCGAVLNKLKVLERWDCGAVLSILSWHYLCLSLSLLFLTKSVTLKNMSALSNPSLVQWLTWV